MKSKISHLLLRTLAALILSCFGAVLIHAQEDPDPNSPTPILISTADSTRALAQPADSYEKVVPNKITPQAFTPGDEIVLYVANIDLMKREGANAFRVYAQDKLGHVYRFPVLSIQLSPNGKRLYAMTVRLIDDLGYWDPPAADGDLLVYLTWRGLASNVVKLGLGQVGGDIREPTGARPTPLSIALSKTAGRTIPPDYVGYRWSGDRTRFLEQATFGPTPALDNLIRRIGIRTWLAEQFEALYPSASNPYPSQPLMPITPPLTCDGANGDDVPPTCFRDTYTLYPIQAWNSKEMLYGDAQLKHRVAWALSEIWVTSGVAIQQSRHMVEYHKVLSANAFGNFRNLMKQMTLHPTMGDYLDMIQSTKNNPNENYAREIMQLFTIGLFMLNPDGTLQLDGSGNPIPTYDQTGVNNLTKVFTGWGYCNVPATCPNYSTSAASTLDYIDPMLLVPNNHDTTAKTLLSYPGSTTTNIAACTNCTNSANITAYANASLDQALDNIFYHPNLGPMVSKTLIQQMVISDPSPAYVGRVAAVFNNNGFGVRGDLKAVVKAILLDPEARGDVKTDPNYGKLREPVQFATNFCRAFNVRSADGTTQSDGVFTTRGEYTGMGQVPFQSPTVFNYYPPGYVVPGTTVLGPEFALMTTGTSIQRVNFINRMVFTAIPIPVSLPNIPNGTSFDFSDLQTLSAADSTGGQLVDELNRRMLHGTMSDSMRSTIMNAVTSVSSTDTLGRARQAVYLVATSSQYQVQR